MTLETFFGAHDDSRLLFDAVRAHVEDIGDVEIRVTKSQVAFARRIGFAYVWMPGQYLGETDVPLVLTVALRRRDTSPRWKQVIEPTPGRFTHHLELRSSAEVDAEVHDWLAEAWALAG
ncbi:MAG: hypothetical protein JXP37_05125 [Coriobacteriia bacterium]|nr:hypothetical protein [Coriobacteriia bacterium]